ncbi:universal stress protein [Zwartia vadi]|uniref:universal stress protein n=1 Tax=Zwartia vadi TaxID=3058168 RepID=UPI0025B5DF9C|nr:universal stress protein [Zwartia vadi]MDN3987042.1 universal stress protein [Zwartia vadi]
MKILVATDGSKNAMRAVKYAADLLKNSTDKSKSLSLISVHDDAGLRHAKAFVGKEAVADYLRELSEKELKPAMKFLNEQGIKHNMVILTGNASQEIVAEGQKGKYDMIVLGSKGRSAIADMLLGSVAQRVLTQAKQPVVLVK